MVEKLFGRLVNDIDVRGAAKNTFPGLTFNNFEDINREHAKNIPKLDS